MKTNLTWWWDSNLKAFSYNRQAQRLPHLLDQDLGQSKTDRIRKSFSSKSDPFRCSKIYDPLWAKSGRLSTVEGKKNVLWHFNVSFWKGFVIYLSLAQLLVWRFFHECLWRRDQRFVKQYHFHSITSLT